MVVVVTHKPQPPVKQAEHDEDRQPRATTTKAVAAGRSGEKVPGELP